MMKAKDVEIGSVYRVVLSNSSFLETVKILDKHVDGGWIGKVIGACSPRRVHVKSGQYIKCKLDGATANEKSRERSNRIKSSLA